MKSLSFSTFINNALEDLFGLRIQPSADSRLNSVRKKIFLERKTKFVIDVGANQGQYGKKIRLQGYKEKITSFEPTSKFIELEKNTHEENNWDIIHKGLGNFVGKTEINISSNDGLSSSLKEPKEILNQGFGITFSNKEVVDIITLDSFLENKDLNNLYLKLDVQGSEMEVLQGALKSLKRISVVEFESALIQLYQGESNHYEIANLLLENGFKPRQLVATHWSESGETISLDAIFERVTI